MKQQIALPPEQARTVLLAAMYGYNAQMISELDQIPLGSFGKPEDVAQAALYLAGPGGRYVTGQVLAIDGGMVM